MKYRKLSILAFPRSLVGIDEYCQVLCRLAKHAAELCTVSVFAPNGREIYYYESSHLIILSPAEQLWICGETVNAELAGLLERLARENQHMIKVHNKAEARSALDWFLKNHSSAKAWA